MAETSVNAVITLVREAIDRYGKMEEMVLSSGTSYPLSQLPKTLEELVSIALAKMLQIIKVK
jgi:hypothetical protein